MTASTTTDTATTVTVATTAERVAELLSFARTHSPFYRDFYAAVPADETRLEAYPVLDHKAFWAANTVRDNRVFTTPLTEGITFKSGGTSGQPKYSVFTHADWRAFTSVFGQGMRRSGLRPGEHIGNLFYAGKLYASFLFSGRCIEAAGAGICYPIGGDDADEILATWRQFDLTTLAGVPTTLMSLLEKLTPDDRKTLKLETFLFAGEPMFPDQIAALQQVFPGCKVRSFGVAGVDYGEMGWVPPGAQLGEHCIFEESTVLEILEDSSDEAIHAVKQPGRLVLTNLNRRLMPIIRYPVGDRGEWLDPVGTPDRRFRLLGRTEEGARVGPMTLYVDDILALLAGLHSAGANFGVQSFQLCVDHIDRSDRLTLRLAVAAPHQRTEADSTRVRDALYAARHMFPGLVDEGVVHPLVVEWIAPSALHTNPRTGKLLRVVDRRHG